MRSIRRYGVVICAAAPLAFAVTGCGGGNDEARRLGGVGILEKTRPLGQNLVKKSAIEAASDSSGVKTLLQFWLALQYQDYELATEYFYPGLANYIGVSQLALSLRNEASLWQSTRPEIVEATTVHGAAHVVFVIRNLVGNLTPVTVSFHRLGSTWRINYLTLLDEALRAWAQERVQSIVSPTSTRPNPKAIAAGTVAMQLQSDYLESEHVGAGAAGRRPGSAQVTTRKAS